ncbi:hypothetical protein [Sorangium sp. So ce1151]|uniref:hypothetical protein n=1 Tax=Sorangium sp. So ce1151 TaxID=3133332 RepID=UPI003F5DE7B1
MRRSGNVIHVSPTLLWELSWVRKMGLEDIDWDPERYCCECCTSLHAVRGEAVEDLVPLSKTRPKLLLRDDGDHATPCGSPITARRHAAAPEARATAAARARGDVIEGHRTNGALSGEHASAASTARAR